ncbi:MAG: hypothetical protein WKF94_03630 [Solirubrobacteraceae bacterium]
MTTTTPTREVKISLSALAVPHVRHQAYWLYAQTADTIAERVDDPHGRADLHRELMAHAVTLDQLGWEPRDHEQDVELTTRDDIHRVLAKEAVNWIYTVDLGEEGGDLDPPKIRVLADRAEALEAYHAAASPEASA